MFKEMFNDVFCILYFLVRFLVGDTCHLGFKIQEFNHFTEAVFGILLKVWILFAVWNEGLRTVATFIGFIEIWN